VAIFGIVVVAFDDLRHFGPTLEISKESKGIAMSVSRIGLSSLRVSSLVNRVAVTGDLDCARCVADRMS
jgi:hypothetical protein